MRCAPAAAPTRCSPSRTRHSFFRPRSTRWSSGPNPTRPHVANCCFCSGKRGANPTILRMRCPPLLRTAKRASALGLHEVLAQAALAYEQTSWRSGLLSPDPPPCSCWRRRCARFPRRSRRSAPDYRARWAGRCSMPMPRPRAGRLPRRSRWPAKSVIRRCWQPISPTCSIFLGAGEHRGAALQRDRDGCRGPESGNLEIVHDAHDWRLPLYLELGDMAGVEADIEGMTRIDARIRQRTYSLQCSALASCWR